MVGVFQPSQGPEGTLPHFTGQILDNMDIVDEDAYTLFGTDSQKFSKMP